MKRTHLFFNFGRSDGSRSRSRSRDSRVHPTTDASNRSTNNDNRRPVIARQPTSSTVPDRVADRGVLEQSPSSKRRSRKSADGVGDSKWKGSDGRTPKLDEDPTAQKPSTSGCYSAGRCSDKKIPFKVDKTKEEKSDTTKQPKPSVSSHWEVARRVALPSKSTTKNTEDETESERNDRGDSPSNSNSLNMRGKSNDQVNTDAIKVKARRLAKRQRRLNPDRPLNPQHLQHPFIRIDIEGENEGIERRNTRWLYKAIRSCVCGIVSKCLITGRDTRNCVCGRWRYLMRKKAEWDAWNPNRNHPFVQWINESKIAGLKEIIKPNRGIFYRVMWLMIFLSLFSTGMKFSVDRYHFHQNSPILFAFKTKEIPIENLPFPTVTVTPFHSFRPSTISNVDRFFNEILAQEFGNSDQRNKTREPWSVEEAATLIYYMDHICSSTSSVTNRFEESGYVKPLRGIPFIEYTAESYLNDGYSKVLNEKISKYLRNVSTDCAEAFKYCTWNLKRSEKCENYFRSVLTNHGVSCSFNNLPLHKLHRRNENPTLRSTWENGNLGSWKFADWDKWSTDSYVMENGKGHDEAFPARQKLGGRPWGLTFIHKMEDTGDCPQFDSSGSRITISVPGTDFDVANLNVVIPPKSEVFVKLIPELITADEELRKVSPELRGCYFQNEKPLAFYNKYSQENCQRECLSNLTLSECKCTLLSFPNSAGERICDGKTVECARMAEEKLHEQEQNGRCGKCLPSCNQMILREEVTFVPLSKEYQSNSPFNSPNDLSSIVHVFYGTSAVLVKERQLRHSKYELLSDIGSIFETTNDFSALGFVRTISSLYVFFPTVWALLKLLVVLLFHGLKKCMRCLGRCFGGRHRVSAHNVPAPSVRVVNVIEVEDEQQIPDTVNINYDIFLVRP